MVLTVLLGASMSSSKQGGFTAFVLLKQSFAGLRFYAAWNKSPTVAGDRFFSSALRFPSYAWFHMAASAFYTMLQGSNMASGLHVSVRSRRLWVRLQPGVCVFGGLGHFGPFHSKPCTNLLGTLVNAP